MLVCRIVKLELFLGEIFTIFKVEQASSGPKGKVKTEALKKEREAQVHTSDQ